MAVEGREQVTRIGIIRVNGPPEELADADGRRQPSVGGTSRVSREAHARICEGLGVQVPGPTRHVKGFGRKGAENRGFWAVTGNLGRGREVRIAKFWEKREPCPSAAFNEAAS